jgi:hypothetical protein
MTPKTASITPARFERLAAVDPELVALLAEWVHVRLRNNGRERSQLLKLKARLPITQRQPSAAVKQRQDRVSAVDGPKGIPYA